MGRIKSFIPSSFGVNAFGSTNEYPNVIFKVRPIFNTHPDSYTTVKVTLKEPTSS